MLIVGFVVIERRHKDPLVPLRIFSNRSLAAADATLLLVVAALFGMFFFLTLYLQQVLGFSALKTGVAYLPLSLTLIASSAVASGFVDRFTPKPILVAGLLISTGGFVFLTSVSGHGDYASHVVPAMVILGIGMGMSFVPVTIAGTSGVAPEDSGLASGLLNTTQQVGGSLGLAILSSVATSRTTSALHTGLALPAALTHGFKGAFIVACSSVRDGRGLHDRAAAGSAARTHRRGRPDGRAVFHTLPRRALLRAPRARRRLQPPSTHPPCRLVEAPRKPRALPEAVGELGARRDVEFAERLAEVVLDGARADERPSRDLSVSVSVRRQPGSPALLGG